MNDAALLDTLLTTIRKRILTHLVLHQSIYAACFGLSALIILLLVGTQVLNWYWPVLLFAVVLAIGIYRFRKRVPSLYLTAQRVDQRLALADALSTAYHFRESADPIAAGQRNLAAQIVPSVDVPAAAPFQLPKSLYPALILAVVAISMLILRYGVMHSLNLDKPLVEGAFEFFKASDSKKLAQFKQQNPLLAKELEKLGISLEDSGNDQMPQGDEKLPDNLLSSPDIPDVNDLTQGKEVAGKPGLESNKDIPGDPSEEGEKGDAGAPGDKQDGGKDTDSNMSSPNEKGSNAQGKKQDAGKKGGDGKSDNPMMDKMRDALANLMNKMKLPNKDNDQNQQAQGQKGGQKGDGKKGKDGQQEQAKNASQGEQNGEQEGEGGDKAQDAQGQGSDKASSDGQSSPDAKSGVGKSDGNKDAKYAEQLNAMGKISEIMGKRAQNITGEVMVEVSSGKQQLRTQYSDSKAGHASTGGEIHRDEVPLEHQQYVQKYFEEVRKGENAGRKK